MGTARDAANSRSARPVPSPIEFLRVGDAVGVEELGEACLRFPRELAGNKNFAPLSLNSVSGTPCHLRPLANCLLVTELACYSAPNLHANSCAPQGWCDSHGVDRSSDLGRSQQRAEDRASGLLRACGGRWFSSPPRLGRRWPVFTSAIEWYRDRADPDLHRRPLLGQPLHRRATSRRTLTTRRSLFHRAQSALHFSILGAAGIGAQLGSFIGHAGRRADLLVVFVLRAVTAKEECVFSASSAGPTRTICDTVPRFSPDFRGCGTTYRGSRSASTCRATPLFLAQPRSRLPILSSPGPLVGLVAVLCGCPIDIVCRPRSLPAGPFRLV